MRTTAVEQRTEVKPERAQAPSKEQITPAPEGEGVGGGVETLLDLQSTAGNTAVTELISSSAAASGDGAPIAPRPPPAVPPLAGLSPLAALARAGQLPPVRLLMGLGGVAASVSETVARESSALHAALPRAEVSPDQHATEPPRATELGHHQFTPVAPNGDEPQALWHEHAAVIEHIAASEQDAHSLTALPLGEHHIIPEGPLHLVEAATVPSTLARDGQPPAAAAEASADEETAISTVAQQEHGSAIRSAIQTAHAALAAEQTTYQAQQASHRQEGDKEVDALKVASKQSETAEHMAALDEIRTVRATWSTEVGGAVKAARAEADQTAARARQAVVAEQKKAQDEERKADQQKQGGGILGAIGSAAGALVDKAKQALSSAMAAVKHAIAGAVRSAASTLGHIAARLPAQLQALGQKFRTAIQERVARARAMVAGLRKALRHGVQAALNAVGQRLVRGLGLLRQGMHAAIEGARSAVSGAVQFAKGAIAALGTFSSLVADVAANPVQWLSNLAAGARDGISHHLWPDLQAAVRGWFTDKLDGIVGLGSAVWGVFKAAGSSLAEIGGMVWETLKSAIPPALISILIERIVSMLVPAAGAALVIVQAIQAAWSSLSRITQAFDAFVAFLKRVRWGDAGPLFGKAIAAGGLALIDFVSNFLLQRIQGALGEVGGKLKALASRLSARLKSGIRTGQSLVGRVGQRVEGAAFLASRKYTAFFESRRLISRAKAAAPQIRSDLKALESATGARMEGLEFEVKSRASLSRKMESVLKSGGGRNDIEREANDALRYTFTFDEAEYSAGTERVIDGLRRQGYEEVITKNFWGRERYKGINSTFKSPTGQLFEVQFHTRGTEGSYHAKQFLTHEDYEKWRAESDPEKQEKLALEMAAKWAQVHTPEGALDIGKQRGT